MYTAVDEHANVTSCSSKEFHAMSGSKRREGLIAKWHAKAPDYVKELHQCPTYKTASTAVLLSRVVKIVPDLREGLAWHRDGKPFRKLRHQAYGQLQDPVFLKPLLENTLVPGQLKLADLEAAPSVDTLSGGLVPVTSSGPGNVAVGGATIVLADLLATEGVLHMLSGFPGLGETAPPPELEPVLPPIPVQERHIGRLFGLLPCKHGLEAVHITGTLTTLWALLRRHEKYHPGGVEKLTGLQLPTEKEWRIYTVPEDSQTPPVPPGAVNKLDDAEKRDQQAQNDATVNEWRTAPGEAGTKGRYGKVLGDYTTTSIKTTWNGFRDLSKKKKKKEKKKKKKQMGQQQQQQQPVLDALRPTTDDVVAVVSERLLAERERRQPAAPAPAQTSGDAPPGQAGEEATQHDGNHPDRRGLGKQRRAALAKRKEAAANAAGGPAKGPQQPVQERHIGRLFGLLPCKHGLEAVHITGTLTTLWALLRRHEKYHPGGVEKLTGLQLPKSDDWRMYTVPEALKLLNLEEVHGIPARKKQAIEACLRRKAEEYQVDAEGKRGEKKTGEMEEEKKTDWFVHVGWAFFALLFNFRRFEGCGWYSAGHWRTNGYSVTDAIGALF
ncbi:hypothetical protein APUTEX25_002831 [Auxenochlorella protothecoides]|uniref:FAS1 domain-containing protein n=1 Tax=Auxenochlorella protothecoides TaxID=3075 RepID=A0A3M7L594_AUXPR|nr:hypothetical protein APUTEX25_002831 [Auxenochlorella protothecoides]|eukprot:RMZ56742.1 hypothetical protein APUTEX25_002831 [Auxenochlorella protothecoides]